MANLTVSFKFTPDSHWLPWQQNLGQNGLYISATARNIYEIFAFIGGWTIKCCQWNFAPTLPGCHDNEILDNMGYNLVSARDICKIFASIAGFWGLGHQILPKKFYPDRPLLPWQRNLRQKGYNSDSVTDISKIFA